MRRILQDRHEHDRLHGEADQEWRGIRKRLRLARTTRSDRGCGESAHRLAASSVSSSTSAACRELEEDVVQRWCPTARSSMPITCCVRHGRGRSRSRLNPGMRTVPLVGEGLPAASARSPGSPWPLSVRRLQRVAAEPDSESSGCCPRSEAAVDHGDPLGSRSASSGTGLQAGACSSRPRRGSHCSQAIRRPGIQAGRRLVQEDDGGSATSAPARSSRRRHPPSTRDEAAGRVGEIEVGQELLGALPRAVPTQVEQPPNTPGSKLVRFSVDSGAAAREADPRPPPWACCPRRLGSVAGSGRRSACACCSGPVARRSARDVQVCTPRRASTSP